MSDQPMLYCIHIPGTLYDRLRKRNAFENNNPTDQAALKVFESAEARKTGGGLRFVMTGEKEAIEHILGYLDSLIELIVDYREFTATELGVTLERLCLAANQEPACVGEAP